MKVFASLFTAGRVFIGVLLLIMVYFLWNGSETVMTKFGMETKTSLRTALATQTQSAQNALNANKQNAATIKELEGKNRELLRELQELAQKERKAAADVAKIQVELEKKVAPIKTQIAKKKIVTDKVIVLPLPEINAKSEANILAMHDTYEKMFAGLPDDTTSTTALTI